MIAAGKSLTRIAKPLLSVKTIATYPRPDLEEDEHATNAEIIRYVIQRGPVARRPPFRPRPPSVSPRPRVHPGDDQHPPASWDHSIRSSTGSGRRGAPEDRDARLTKTAPAPRRRLHPSYHRRSRDRAQQRELEDGKPAYPVRRDRRPRRGPSAAAAGRSRIVPNRRRTPWRRGAGSGKQPFSPGWVERRHQRRPQQEQVAVEGEERTTRGRSFRDHHADPSRARSSPAAWSGLTRSESHIGRQDGVRIGLNATMSEPFVAVVRARRPGTGRCRGTPP